MNAGSLRARLVAGYLALVVLLAGGTAWWTERSLGDAQVRELDGRLEAQAVAVARWLDDAGHPERLAPRLGRVVAARITVVDAEGRVEGDSVDGAASVGRPVGNAPELAAARRGAVGRAQRPVVVGGPPMRLVAVPAAGGRAVRVAVPVAALAEARDALRLRVAVAALAGLAVAALLGLWAIRAVTRPLREMTALARRLAAGDYAAPAAPPPEAAPDELAVLRRALGRLAEEIRARVAELTAARDLSAAVLDALVEGVVAVDGDGRVVLANRAAQALLGDPPALPGALAARLAAAAPGRTGAGEEAVQVDDRTVQVAVRALESSRGAVAVLYDVTRLRALERGRRDFLASAAHELRTPVAAIAGFSETVLAGGLDDATRDEFLATIHRNAGRIARLVDDLLALERLGTRGTRLLERVAVPLAPVVATVIASTRAAATARGEPEPHVVAGLEADVAVLADPDGLVQVLQNLVDNAVVHGDGDVTITAARHDRRVTLTVADRGSGIPPEHRERVFEQFFRVEPARRRAGNGLGLALVRRQVQAMGGEVRAEARADGPGAALVVTLDHSPAQGSPVQGSLVQGSLVQGSPVQGSSGHSTSPSCGPSS